MTTDMSNNDASFFRLLELGNRDLPDYPEAMAQLRRGDHQGILVHDVYDGKVLEEVVDRLEQHDPPFVQTWFPGPFRSWFFGCNLNLTENLTYYFAESPRFAAQLAELFPNGQGVCDYLASRLALLDNGRRFCAPPGPAPGSEYMFTTIRAHMEGGYIPAHVDNEQAVRPSFHHLQTLIEPHLVSFVACLAQPDDGGLLEIFDSKKEATARSVANLDHVEKPNLDGVASVKIRIPTGAMAIVDSGVYMHRVSPIVGPRKRWTLCSFMALSRDHDAMYCWG